MQNLDHLSRSQLLLQYLYAMETSPIENGALSVPADNPGSARAAGHLSGLPAPQEI